jgi:hypothetical protein
MRLQDPTTPTTTLTPPAPTTRLTSHTALKKTESKDEQAARQAADHQKVSEGIEGMFVRQMLEASHMFEGVGGHPMMQGMMIEKLADAVAKGGNLGIGALVSGQGGVDAASPNRTVHGPQAGGAMSSMPATSAAAAATARAAHAVAGVDDADALGSADELALMRAPSSPAAAAASAKKKSDFGFGDVGFGDFGFGGFGDLGDFSVGFGDLSLPDDLLPREASQALKDGRVDGLGPGGSVDEALRRAWRPVEGTPQGDTGVIPLSQADSNAILGDGPKTIRQAGCLLTSMTMVSNALTGARHSVDDANRLVSRAGGFSGNNMKMGPASSALGLKVMGGGVFTGDTRALDASLAAGRPVVVGVDHKPGASSVDGRTDHFLVVTGRSDDGGYTAIDSGNGKPLTFRDDGSGHLRSGKYDLSTVITVAPSSAAPARAPAASLAPAPAPVASSTSWLLPGMLGG